MLSFKIGLKMKCKILKRRWKVKIITVVVNVNIQATIMSFVQLMKDKAR